jgi:type I restriction enzyme M protein
MKRRVLDLLQRAELLALTDRFDVDVSDRRVKSQLVDALAASRRASLSDILSALSRGCLKDLCKGFGLDDGGREKAVLVERILSAGAKQQPPGDSDQVAEPKPPKRAGAKKEGGDLGFEDKLWKAADELRGNMDAAEYKHVVLGLIFLKYVSDAFADRQHQLEAEKDQGADPEDPDEYRGHNVFWVPKEARLPSLQAQAKQPTIGKLVDDAMIAVERDNPSLKGVLPKDCGMDQEIW